MAESATGAFDKSFSKTLELAKKKLDRLEAGYREAEARVAELEAAKPRITLISTSGSRKR